VRQPGQAAEPAGEDDQRQVGQREQRVRALRGGEQRGDRGPGRGQAALDPAVQLHLVEAIADGPPSGTAPASLPDGLTPREAEVLALIAAGLSNAEIAERLVVSEATVKSHVNHMLAKIGARDRAQAVGYAYRHGLVSR
jgi:DNA-binding NarL/FixJ family response regulator